MEPVDNRVEAKENSFHRGNLSLVEHTFIYGSEEVEGEIWNTKRVFEFLNKEKNEDKVREKLLKPPLILVGEKKNEEVNELRSLEGKRVKGRMEGIFQAFDVEQQAIINFEDPNIKQYIELDDVNGSGRISGEWRVGLVDGGGNEIDASELKLDEDFAKHFTLAKDPGGKSMVLKLKLGADVMTAGKALEEKEELPLTTNDNLSPFEQVVYGSSLLGFKVGDKELDITSSNLEAIMQDEDARRIALSPINLSRGRKKIEQIEQEREATEIDPQPHLTIFEFNPLREYRKEKVGMILGLDRLDNEGQTSGFGIYLVKNGSKMELPMTAQKDFVIHEKFRKILEYVGSEDNVMKFKIIQNAPNAPDKI